MRTTTRGTTFFGPRRIAAFGALWRALTQASRPGSPGIAERVAAVPRMLGGALLGRYPGLGLGKVAAVALGLVYLVSPVDLVPELLLSVVGLVDDAVVALWLGGVFLAETQRFLDWERDVAPTRAAAGPAVVDGMVVDATADGGAGRAHSW